MYHECRHILPNGKRCQSPALRNHDFCYFHSVHRVRPDAEVTSDLQLPPLEDPDAIQLALSQLAQAIASGRMEVRRARTLAMVLRIASQNFRHTLAARQQLENKPQEEEPKIYQPETVRETCPHADGTLIAPPKECPDPEEIPVPESKWSLGRLLLKEAELFRERRRREKAELEEKIRNSERGARFFGFEPDPPQPGTLPTVKAESFCKPRPCKNLQIFCAPQPAAGIQGFCWKHERKPPSRNRFLLIHEMTPHDHLKRAASNLHRNGS